MGDEFMRRLVEALLIPVAVGALVASSPASADLIGRVRVAQKVDPDKFQKQFQDVRGGIDKDRAAPTPPSAGAPTGKVIVDVCKQNPKLPQCKL
jgi:hypothetical protein